MRILTEEEVCNKPDDHLRTVKGFGWAPELPDKRDWGYSEKYLMEQLKTTARSAVKDLPVRTILKNVNKYMPVVDQGDLGSCTGNAGSYFFQYVRRVVQRSRLQLYYEARRKEGTTNEDAGAYIRDIFLVLRELGAGRESWWPYDPSKFAVDPIDKVDRDAMRRRLLDALSLQNLDNSGDEYRHCLAEGFPFNIGFTVFSGFMSQRVAQFGIYGYPDLKREYDVGGHAVCAIGYDWDFQNSEWAKNAVASGLAPSAVPSKVFIIRNSWGPNWGKGGDVAIDANFLSDLDFADDAWTGRNVASASSGIVQ
jgi:C1A family cysteine protease